jgi:hypothetical protein
MAFKDKKALRKYQYAWVRQKYATDPEWVRRRNAKRAARQKRRRRKDPVWREGQRVASAAAYRKYGHTPLGRLRRLVVGSRVRARKKGLPFGVTVAELSPPPKFCPVLGLRLNYGPGGRTDADRASLDRIDNSKGYVKGNVAVISNRANQLKSDATLAELRAVAAYVERGKP